MALLDERAALGAELAAGLRAQDLPIVCAYLFGSQARQQAGVLSDVDVAVLFEPSLSSSERFGMELALASGLERRLGRPVDLVVLNGAPPALAHRVVRDGVVVVSRDDRQRTRFEASVMSEYLDLPGRPRSVRRSPAREGAGGTPWDSILRSSHPGWVGWKSICVSSKSWRRQRNAHARAPLHSHAPRWVPSLRRGRRAVVGLVTRSAGRRIVGRANSRGSRDRSSW